jgi:formyl-CoA transferase
MIHRMSTREGYELDVPGIVPKLSATPGAIRAAAPRLGEDTAEVLSDLGVSAETLADLAARGIV